MQLQHRVHPCCNDQGRSGVTGHLPARTAAPVSARYQHRGLPCSTTHCARAAAREEDLPRAEEYPKYEDSKEDEGKLLPRRDPGTFPPIALRPTGLVRAFSDFKANVWDDAAALYAVKDESGDKPYDPLRDGPLRYLGYANEVGEAFAAWLPPFGVPLSYAVAISYVLVDTGDKGRAAYREAGAALGANKALPAEVDRPRLTALLAGERTLDTLVWQLLASVACPGYTIHTVVALVHALLRPLEALDPVQQGAAELATSLHTQSGFVLDITDRTIPTLCGLAAIPFIVHPLDNAVHALLNFTLRPAMRRYVCGPGQGCLADLAQCASCGDGAKQEEPRREKETEKEKGKKK